MNGLSRRDFVKALGCGAATALTSARTSLMAAEPVRQAKANILFLITDQQWAGALSCAGNPLVKTPHLDRLAARGVRFERSYCTYPLCCPSRTSLFASRMPHELGVYGNFDAELADKNVPTMGPLFSAAGYDTAYAGKWHLQAPFPAFKGRKAPGFDVLPLGGKDPHAIDMGQDGKGLTVDPNTADAAIRFLRQPRSEPFLLTVSVLNPHDICEYAGCAALQRMRPADAALLPPARPNLKAVDRLPSALARQLAHADWSERQWQEYLYVYCRLVEIADREVGRVLEALEAAGLTESTLVVFTSDHGEMMGSHQMITKQKLYDEAAAVPLIIAGPGVAPQVDRTHLASGLDILPTLLDYAGIAVPPTLRGRSLRPLTSGTAVPWREFVAAETSSAVEARMVRSARHKYIRYAQGSDREQLFDMEADPGEARNLAGEPAAKAELERHQAFLQEWMTTTRDGFGKGPAPGRRPAGVRQAAPGE